MAAQVIQTMKELESITEDKRALLRELFDSLEVAHMELASACSTLSRLSQKLRPHQLMTVLWASIHPMIQINAMAVLLEPPVVSRRSDLPDNQYERVQILMTPDPTVKSLRTEKINSPTQLLAAAWVFRILNRLSSGTTQWRMQEVYGICTKQLAACITGKKYLGGTDRKSKTSGGEEGPSTLKKPTTE